MRATTAILALATTIGAWSAHGQTYPVRPVHIVVPFPAGGSSDVTARLVGQKLSDELGQPVVIENRTGAGGAIGVERAATSLADGYTLLLFSTSDAALAALRGNKLPYDVARDFAPVALVASGSLVLTIHPSTPAHTVKQLIALVRSQPGRLNFGTGGVGSSGHFAGELFNMMSGVKLVHVPYKGGSESAVATVVGQVEISFPAVPSALPLLTSGKLRPLAVTSAVRTTLLPSLPTLNEAGLSGYDRPTWNGILAPAAVPKDIMARLAGAIGKIISSADAKASLNKLGLDAQSSTPAQFWALIQNEMAQDVKLIKFAGIKGDN